VTEQAKSVAIIIRLLDRADELAYSLPRLLNQDYPNYDVYVIDHSSQDGLEAVLCANVSPRLHVIRVPRPEYFNRSRASNIGVRYTESDLLFFLDSGIGFRDDRHLSEIIQTYEQSVDHEPRYFEDWRARSGYASVTHKRMSHLDTTQRRVYMECECHGLHLIAPREVIQEIGGLNEALLDWGFEDTDLTTRLELAGYGRLEITELVHSDHHDELRTRFHREQEKEKSWERNKQISDGFIRTFGAVLATQPCPGMVEWVELEGRRYEGDNAPQQSWQLRTAGELYPRRVLRSVRLSRRDPIVTVVVPTRDAAQYIVVVLDSILGQEYENIECIVADGGSTDATLEILEAYGDRVIWSSEPDNGAFDAINRGWQDSQGEILAWLNADDFWTPNAVANAVKAFRENPDADLIYGNCLIVDGDDNILEYRRPPLWDLAWAVENSHHMIDQPAMFLRRSIVQRIGWLYPAWFHDWELWRRVSLAGGRIRRVPYLLGGARIRRDNSQYNPRILIDGLINLQKRFFSMPAVTNNTALRKIKKRAMSNTYLKIVQTLQYGRPEEKKLRLQLRWKAFKADWTNFFNVLRTTPRGRSWLPYDPDEHQPLPHIASLQALKEEVAAARYSNGEQPSFNGRSAALAEKMPRYEPLVSVVIPCRNDIRFLPSVIDSVLSQDYPNIECIVVDANSTDGTQRLLARYGDKIRWVSRPDNGAFDAINEGWRMSRGEVLAWLNADDLWTPGAVKTAVDYLGRHPEMDVVYGTAGVVDEVGTLWGDLVPRPFELRSALLNCDHIIYQAAAFIRRGILEEVDYLYPAWCHDHDLWLRIAHKGGRFGQVHARLGVDRLRGDNLGRVRDLVIDAKLGLTRRFFDNPDLLPQLLSIRRRSMSNAYVRCLDYLDIKHPTDWLKGATMMTKAIAVDPRNTLYVVRQYTKPFRWHVRTTLARPAGIMLAPIRFGWRLFERSVRFIHDRPVGVMALAVGVAAQAVIGAAAIEDGTLDGVATRIFQAGALAALFAIWLQMRWRWR